MRNTEKKDKKRNSSEKKIYGFKISESFYNQIDKHIRILKFSKESQNQSKGKWFENAINEKLENESNPSIDSFPKQRHLSIYLEKDISDKLEARINKIKKFRSFYSRKEWVLEAIQEKIEREKPKTKQILEEIQD